MNRLSDEIWYIRVAQSHSKIQTLCNERLYSRMELKHFDYCQGLYHCTLVDNLSSILKSGLQPAGRLVHFHPFPPGHLSIRLRREAITQR